MEEVASCRYSVIFPVSGCTAMPLNSEGPTSRLVVASIVSWWVVVLIVAIPPKAGDRRCGGMDCRVLLLTGSGGAAGGGSTPRDGAGTPCVGFWGGFVVSGGWWRSSCSWINSPLRVWSMFPTYVSVGGFSNRTFKSSTVARRSSSLVSLGNALCGNHTTWFTIRLSRVLVAHTVKHR